jgi:hypothetical protein
MGGVGSTAFRIPLTKMGSQITTGEDAAGPLHCSRLFTPPHCSRKKGSSTARGDRGAGLTIWNSDFQTVRDGHP